MRQKSRGVLVFMGCHINRCLRYYSSPCQSFGTNSKKSPEFILSMHFSVLHNVFFAFLAVALQKAGFLPAAFCIPTTHDIVFFSLCTSRSFYMPLLLQQNQGFLNFSTFVFGSHGSHSYLVAKP